MSRTWEYPNVVPGLAAAGADTLRGTMGTFADWQIRPGHRLDPGLVDAPALAADLLECLAYPEHAFDPLPPDAQDRVALALGLPARTDWRPPGPVAPGTPSYRLPSWEKDVHAVLFRRRELPPPVPRIDPEPGVDADADWPQVATPDAWAATRAKAATTRALATRLGADWSVSQPLGPARLAVLTNRTLDLPFVVVPGGSMRMGLTRRDRAAADRRAVGWGPEAGEHLAAMTTVCRPVRVVRVSAFLCARTPLLDRHAQLLGIEGDAGGPHRVLRTTSMAAAGTPAGFRLPSEAQWEWLARGAQERTWLSGDRDPEDWAAAVLTGPLDADHSPFGVHGLGWGEWVDDGWHPSYRKAPATSRPWDPMSRPQVARGGCLALWPWQSGEGLFACTAARDRPAPDALNAIRLVRDLPPR